MEQSHGLQSPGQVHGSSPHIVQTASPGQVHGSSPHIVQTVSPTQVHISFPQCEQFPSSFKAEPQPEHTSKASYSQQ